MLFTLKKRYPEIIEELNIPLDEYPRRSINNIKKWAAMRKELLNPEKIEHTRSNEFAAKIIEACETDIPCRIYGNVQNTGLIPNLMSNACVEVPIMIDRNELNPCYVGELPEQLAALNRTNINVQLMTIKGAAEIKKEYIYGCIFDPHTLLSFSLVK